MKIKQLQKEYLVGTVPLPGIALQLLLFVLGSILFCQDFQNLIATGYEGSHGIRT